MLLNVEDFNNYLISLMKHCHFAHSPVPPFDSFDPETEASGQYLLDCFYHGKVSIDASTCIILLWFRSPFYPYYYILVFIYIQYLYAGWLAVSSRKRWTEIECHIVFVYLHTNTSTQSNIFTTLVFPSLKYLDMFRFIVLLLLGLCVFFKLK